MNDEERIIELEIKVSHQEVLIEGLQQSLYDHYLMIEKLKKDLKDLTDRFEGAVGGEDIGPHNKKPPHY